MKILFVGDAIVPSGFSRCTHAVCDELHARGHEVAVLGLNYFGDPHPYPYPIYPCRQPLDHGHDGHGNGRLPHLIHRLNPDTVVILNDPWNIPNYIANLKHTLADDFPLPNLVGWLAVDGENQKGFGCEDLDMVVAWTKFAQDQLRTGGYTGPFKLVTLGVDPAIFQPRDKMESRRYLGPLAEMVGDKFLIGAIGRNQQRKRLDLTIRYFADFVNDRGIDAYLYLHVGPTGDTGFDLESLNRFYGVQHRVIVGRAALGVGAEDKLMPSIYSMLDLYITTTQGEGFGLPVLEAMACGVPCIVPRWSALAEWPEGAVVSIPCTSTAMTAPTNGMLHTIGGVPDSHGFVQAMHDMYVSELHRTTYRDRGLRRAAKLPWSTTATRFSNVLESLLPSKRTAGDLGKPRNERVQEPAEETVVGV